MQKQEIKVAVAEFLFSDMLHHLVCGAFHPEVDEEPPSRSPISSQIKSQQNSCCSRKKKNPYSTRGLDKFSKLLANVEDKRQKIYSQMGSQNISLIRFSYNNANDCVPVVVKVRNKDEEDKSCEIQKDRRATTSNHSRMLDKDHSTTDVMKMNLSRYLVLNKLRRPSYYIPIALILILLFLAVFGRSVAVICTSLLWYLIPVIDSTSRSSKKMKQDYATGSSGKKMAMDGLRKYHARGSKQNSPTKRILKP